MGAKITIDSATLMNKGLEVIEAKWLFQLESHQIDTIVHPQSIIHSIVQFDDGSMKAQMGLPDMKLPIQYAMAYPNRIFSDFPRFNFLDYPQLTFEKADLKTYKNLQLAYEALNLEGTAACALNAANEITNTAFLQDKIKFLDIADINEKVMNQTFFVKKPGLEDYVNCNLEARRLASELL
jgi:1-deoxy-D-xylulose-5-phosphate reductoisomerase